MQKLMFNDKYGLTQAVLEGHKTMTRRIVKDGTPLGNWGEIEKYAKYKIGEVVAVAQSYQSIEKEIRSLGLPLDLKENIAKHKGYTNKMFVKSSYMPHRIRITNIKVERLQHITDEDCLKEGVYYDGEVDGYKVKNLSLPNKPYWAKCMRQMYFKTPREAFAALIDKVSGKGTWESNPWVYVYSFELVK